MLKNKVTTIALAVTLFLSGYTPAAISNAAAAGPQTKCPVFSGKIDKKIYTNYKGKRIYFCCKDCIEEFNKKPDKYIKTMEDQGVEIENSAALWNAPLKTIP